jgi:hypothetical protein
LLKSDIACVDPSLSPLLDHDRTIDTDLTIDHIPVKIAVDNVSSDLHQSHDGLFRFDVEVAMLVRCDDELVVLRWRTRSAVSHPEFQHVFIEADRSTCNRLASRVHYVTRATKNKATSNECRDGRTNEAEPHTGPSKTSPRRSAHRSSGWPAVIESSHILHALESVPWTDITGILRTLCWAAMDNFTTLIFISIT